MKNNKLTSFFMAFLAILLVGNVANAQFDDLYYDASDEVSYTDAESYEEYDSEAYDDSEYDNAEYTAYDWEEDEYIYSKRINRFYRPSRNLGYYGSYYNSGLGYSDFGYYDNSRIYGRNALRSSAFRYNSFNDLGYNRFSPYYAPRNGIVVGNRFGSPFGIGSSYARGGFGGGAFGGSAYYCPPSYNINSNRRNLSGTVNNGAASGRNVVTSSRNSGSTSRSISNNPRSNRSSATSAGTRSRTNANTSSRRSSPRSYNTSRSSSRSSSARSNSSRSSRSYAPSTRSTRSSGSYRPSSSRSSGSRSIRSSSPSRSSSSARSSRSSSRSSKR